MAARDDAETAFNAVSSAGQRYLTLSMASKPDCQTYQRQAYATLIGQG